MSDVVSKVRFWLTKSPLRIPVYWYRRQSLGDADVVFSAYPRSGVTWLRFLLCNLLTGEDPQFSDVNRTLLRVGFQSRSGSLLPGGGWLLGTHEPYYPEFRKAMYLVRDVRDVAVSEFEYFRFRGLIDAEFDDFLDTFINHGLSGYGDWRSHVLSWQKAAAGKAQDILWLQYERMRRDPQHELSRIADFLGLARTAEDIAQAVENNSFEKMQLKEDRADKRSFRSRVPGHRFVRKGQAGGWQSRLTGNQVRRLEDYAGPLLERLGFDSPGQES